MFLNIIQLAESLGVEEPVVEGWIKNEGLPCVRDSGRLLFDRAQVARWAAERGLAARTGFLAPGSSKPGALSLERLLRIGGIWRGVAPAATVGTLTTVLQRLPGTTPAVRQVLAQRLAAPKGLTWAPIGDGWALPHLRSHVALGGDAGLAALVMLEGSMPMVEPPLDGLPVTRMVFFIAPSPRAHLEILARLSGALARGRLKRVVAEGAPDEAIYAAVGGEAAEGGP
jgi:PTS system nitrogen regulatory IIA component